LVLLWQNLHWCLTKKPFFHCLQVWFLLVKLILPSPKQAVFWYSFIICDYWLLQLTVQLLQVTQKVHMICKLTCYQEIIWSWSLNFKMEMERFDWAIVSCLCFSFWWKYAHSFYLLLQKIVDSIEQLPAVEVVLGEHVFFTVGDHYLAAKSDWFSKSSFFIFYLVCMLSICKIRNTEYTQACLIVRFEQLTIIILFFFFFLYRGSHVLFRR